MDNTDNNDINFIDNSPLIINSNLIDNYDMNDTDTILKIIRDSNSGMNNTHIKYESDNSEIINFFNNIILKQNKNNKMCRSADISIDNDSYLRVTNNIDNYCCTIQNSFGHGYSKWFYFNSSIDGIGFIINVDKYWKWQKKSDFKLI
jgi:hypothetical protein